MGLVTKPNIKTHSPSVYSLKKLGRIIDMTPDRVWLVFFNIGLLKGLEEKTVVTKNITKLMELATLPHYATVFRAYKTIEKFTNKANYFLLEEMANTFGPKLLVQHQSNKNTVLTDIYTSTVIPSDTEMRADFIVLQDQLIQVLQKLVTSPDDVYKMVAYIQEGDFFGKVIAITKQASSEDYITLQRNFEAVMCELVSELMISLPGGLMEAPVLLNTYDEILKTLYSLLQIFTITYVDLIKKQCAPIS